MIYIRNFLNNRLKKHFLIISSLSILLIIILLNLGRLVDITDSPKKSDIIVYLGGGYMERMEKSLELYKLGYSETNKIILTGTLIGQVSKEDLNGFNKIKYLKGHGIPEKNIIYAQDTRNTMKEIVFVKNYMLKHLYKSVIFVSDPPHSGRIKFLAKIVNKYNDVNLSAIVVGSDVDWWDRTHYYKDTKARKFVISELSKMIHNFIAYGILQKLGLLETIKESFGPIISFFKGKVYNSFVGTNQ